MVWTTVQLAPLLLGISATPLWARYTPPREHATMVLVLSVQIFAAAALRGWLFVNRESFVFVGFSSTLALLLATMASNQSLATWVVCGAFDLVWFAVLAGSSVAPMLKKNPWFDLIALLLATILIGEGVAPHLL